VRSDRCFSFARAQRFKRGGKVRSEGLHSLSVLTER
jgi:hypothetical protein